MGVGGSIEAPNDDERSNLRKSETVRDQLQKEFHEYTKEEDDEKEVDMEIEKKSNEGKEKQITINPSLFRAKSIFMKPIKGKKPITKRLIVKKQNNAALLKEMYRRMDPSFVTSDSKLIVGEVELAIKYKPLEENLLVKICRAKKLQKTDSFGFPDPYVVVELSSKRIPSQKLQRKTAVKGKTTDPIFQEIVMFPLKEKMLADSKLRVTVWDKDVVGNDDFLGESIIELCKLDLNSGDIFSYNLHPQIDDSISGDVEVTLSFAEPNIFSIILNGAYNLKTANNTTGTSNPFARVYSTGIPTKFETKVEESTLNPQWEETFEFTIHPDEFARRVIIVSIMSAETGGQAKRLGDAHIPLTDIDFSKVNERLKYPLQDLRNTPYTRSKWSEEGLSIEFREAMCAHAIYGYPKFLFKKQHRGKMLVSVESGKARTKAKMIVQNGVPVADPVQL